MLVPVLLVYAAAVGSVVAVAVVGDVVVSVAGRARELLVPVRAWFSDRISALDWQPLVFVEAFRVAVEAPCSREPEPGLLAPNRPDSCTDPGGPSDGSRAADSR